MKRPVQILSVMILLLISASIHAQVIKIASMAPEASPWGVALNRMAADWSRVTNGRVRVQIYHGAIAGSDEDTIRKMRLGQIHGTVITSAGLALLMPEFISFSIPGVIRNEDELDFVLSEMEPFLDEKVQEAGYQVLTWGKLGWLQFFSNADIRTPDDLPGRKVATGTLPEEVTFIFREFGMTPVAVSTRDTLGSLNSGVIDTVVYPPLGVAGYQWFGISNHMLEYQISPIIGCVLIDSRAWNRIPRRYHQELLAISREVGVEMNRELYELEQEALSLMQEYGLDVHQVSAPDRLLWQETFDAQTDKFSRDTLQSDIMRNLVELLEEYR